MKFLTSKINQGFLALCISMFGSFTAFAQVDTTAIGTSIDASKDTALTTGEMVVGAVTALVVIGLILAMIRKF